jgi:hypothetical protein
MTMTDSDTIDSLMAAPLLPASEEGLRVFDGIVAAFRSVHFEAVLLDRLHADRAQRRDAAEGAVVIPSFVTTLEVPDAEPGDAA